MINLKNIAKVLLIALFVCVWSGDDVLARPKKTDISREEAEALLEEIKNRKEVSLEDLRNKFESEHAQDYKAQRDNTRVNIPIPSWKYNVSIKGSNSEDAVKTTTTPGDQTEANFCTADYGIFSSLLKTGTKIFNRLRDLIYVVAGFGIIAVAVGGFFGNLNWKWLGAIVISLVVIATAGELIVMITGCEVYGSSLITNTLENPTPMKTADYNANYTEGVSHNTWIEWDDSMDVRKEPAAVETEAAAAAEAAAAGE